MTRLRWVLGGVLLVAIIASGVTGALLHSARNNTMPTPPDYTAIMSTASAVTAKMNTYQPDTVGSVLTDIRPRLTGPYLAELDAKRDALIAQTQTEQINRRATIQAAGVQSADESTASVIVFWDATITRGAQAPTNGISAEKVHLVKVGDTWLVDGSTSLPASIR